MGPLDASCSSAPPSLELWDPVSGTLPLKFPPSTFPRAEYKMEPNPGPGLMAPTFPLLCPPLQLTVLSPLATPFPKSLRARPSDSYGQAKGDRRRTVGSS